MSSSLMRRVDSRNNYVYETKDAQSEASERNDYGDRGLVHYCTYATERVILSIIRICLPKQKCTSKHQQDDHPINLTFHGRFMHV